MGSLLVPQARNLDGADGERKRAFGLAQYRSQARRHAATPIRAISHSSLTPECSSTLRRTTPPRSSISAAVALPRLIRELQCISDTCAAPLVNPRQPAASINCQALLPGGFLKVEPPVRLFTGCVDSRASVIFSISAAITFGSPRSPPNSASVKM